MVAPVDQRYDAPLAAVSVTLPPAQNVVGPLAVTVASTAVTGMTRSKVAPQPFGPFFVSRTVTVAAVCARKVMALVPAPETMSPSMTCQLYETPLV